MTGAAQIIVAYGAFFMQLAAAGFIALLAWGTYHLFRPMSAASDLETKYTKSEEVLLHKSMEKKGINLGVEILKLRELERPASLRRKIREQIIKDFYPAEKESK